MEKRKNNRTKEQGAETKKQIYACAEKLFRADDYQNVSVEAITNMAGVTKGTFYVHFESKDALIALLIADHTSRADTIYKAFLETLPPDMPAPNVLLALTERITEVLTGSFGCDNMKKVYQMMLAGTVDTEAVKNYNRELYVLFHGVLERGIRKGELKSTMPVEALVRHFVAAFRGISYEWCIRYPDFDLKEQAAQHVRLLIEGIQPR